MQHPTDHEDRHPDQGEFEKEPHASILNRGDDQRVQDEEKPGGLDHSCDVVEKFSHGVYKTRPQSNIPSFLKAILKGRFLSALGLNFIYINQ